MAPIDKVMKAVIATNKLTMLRRKVASLTRTDGSKLCVDFAIMLLQKTNIAGSRMKRWFDLAR